MSLKINKRLLGLLILTFSVFLFSGCSKTLDTASNIYGEWTYLSGLAEIEFDNSGNAAIMTPDGETEVATQQVTYKLEDDKLTFISKETGETIMEADVEITEKSGTEYLTLSNIENAKVIDPSDPSTLEFKKLSDSTEAIETSTPSEDK